MNDRTKDLEESVDAVCDKATFISFLDALARDYQANANRWANQSLASYLESMHAWLEDMDLDAFYRRIQRSDVLQRDVNWRVFADVLMAATMYE